MRVTRHVRGFAIGLLFLGLVMSACSIEFGGDGRPETGQPRVEATGDVDIAFGPHDVAIPINPLLFGTNVPAWVNPTRTAQPWFTTAVEESGATMLRFPGGSWSNWYEWQDCMEGTSGCHWPWALAPQDYAQVIVDTGLPAMWTANINATAEANAALVAFFNGEVGDERTIGVDRNGVDWLTVGHWAARRASFGFADPVRIDRWELGNEVYGAVAATGPSCAEFGWEEVWTCDGAEYMLGIDGHDGFNTTADAMRAVDPAIEVGAVGVSPADSWNGFGTEVLAHGNDSLDFYIVHTYAFGGSFATEDVLATPLELDWGGQVADIDAAAAEAGHPASPVIAVTEYNLVAWQDADDLAVMTTMRNLFVLVGWLGEMAAAEVDMATQWGLISGLQDNGTDYGVIEADSQRIYPSFFALRLWAGMGDRLIPVSDHPELTEYATAGADGSTTVLLANPSEASVSVTIGAPDGAAVSAEVVTATSLDSRSVTYNGTPAATLDDIVGVEPLDLGAASTTFTYDVPAVSLVVLRFDPS